MNNFIYANPTRILFGRGMETRTGAETAAFSRNVLLHYGSGSIKASGLYDRVTDSLRKAGVSFTELSGVKANPTLALAQEGIRICREKKIDFILAVGGGSVIDSAKCIAAGVPYAGDVWDFYTEKGEPKTSLPVGVVLTIPAAGSESSTATVITREDGLLKRAFDSDTLIPRFAVLNPELAFTLPPYQAACGAADIMAHLMERYFTNVKHVELTDRLIEGALKTMIQVAPKVLQDPKDYNAWADFMWTGTIAHNNLLSTGRVGDWATHMIEHELSGMYDLAHGAGLAMVFPAWMRHVLEHDLDRFVQFAMRVWNVEADHFDRKATALAGIDRLESFWGSLDLATRIRNAGLGDDLFEEMAAKCTDGGQKTVGNFVKLGKADVLQIYRLAY